MNQYIKIVIYAVSGLFILGALFLLARPAPKKETASIIDSVQSKLSAAQTSFDFESISMAKGKVSHRFSIKNEGPDPVIVKKIYTSCMCTEGALIKEGVTYGPHGMPGHGFLPSINVEFGPGEQAEVEAIFDPAAHGPAGVGPIERAIYLEQKSGDIFELRFTANVTP